MALGCRASAIIYQNTRVYGDYQLIIAINASTRQLTVEPNATSTNQAQIQKQTHTLCHYPYPTHSHCASHVTLKSLRSLRCRLELGKNTVNSNSTTGLFVFIFSFLRQTFSPSDKLRERRATQQSRDCNLAIILISTVVMFFLCHLPRVVTRLVFFTLLWSPSHHRHHGQHIIFTNSIFSIYEAANIHSILDCRERGLCFWCTLNSCFTKEHEKHHDSFSLEKL